MPFLFPAKGSSSQSRNFSTRLLSTSILTSALFFNLSSAQNNGNPSTSPRQMTESFVEQTTGLKMERFFDASTSFGFSMALPTTPLTPETAGSFIGQLDFPLVDGQGWGAMGLTGDDDGNLLLAVWNDGKDGVAASFRQSTNDDNPPAVSGTFAVRPLPDGIVANATALSYTFLCENCLNSTLGFRQDPATGNAVMGWAFSPKAPQGDRADPGAAVLNFDDRFFGPFTARLGEARNEKFEDVAKTAGEAVAPPANAVPALAGVAEFDVENEVEEVRDGDVTDDEDDD
ncbi:iron reductase domain protein [Aaosphaeria arxii CBS 175.79]|uniref:Iron reductase domain protein n=1 Tax=Aaosphaeria arxii CBS 175.79 TaxID=1450172 RepID=A0A6A5X9N1_9PLEO|nr:iron reductase domain protein [Aaosphaeria arxii CBS 175.79]KAF2009576.1 iron reductase domain protein [Aaosphaeria arxii CBS 175.79]